MGPAIRDRVLRERQAGTEGWADYTVRNGVPTYVVDQAGRGRSGFDQSVIHEGEALIDTNPTAAKALIPTLGGSTSTAWTSWFGHIVPSRAIRYHDWPDGPPWRPGTSIRWHARTWAGSTLRDGVAQPPTASNWGGSRWNLRLLGPSTKPSHRVPETARPQD